MRTFSSAIQTELNKQYSGEPMVIAEIAWDGDQFIAYTDRKLNGENYPFPYIISLGSFDTTTIISGSGDSQNVNIVLNDIDGTLRDILDTQDIHLKPVRLYLIFQGLSINSKALMFEGVINSPIVWNESDRTLSFTVFSKLEDTEAGFSMEDGNFPYIPPEDRGKSWPLVFGEVCNMQAVKVTALRKGYLAQGIGIPDPTIDERLCQAYYLQCPLTTEILPVTSDAAGWSLSSPGVPTAEEVQACNEAWASLNIDTANIGFGSQYLNLCGGSVLYWPTVRTGKPDPQCVTRKQNEICTILQEKQQQEQYVVNPFTIRGGENFPQGEEITIKIGEVRFIGIMTGESFLATSRHHPDEDRINNPTCTETPEAGLGFREDDDYDNPPLSIAECESGGGVYNEDVRGGASASWEYYESFEKGSFIWLPSGSEVILSNESNLVHIVSLLPGIVNQVAAYRTYGDTSLLTELDTSLYTVHLEDYGDYQTTEIWLDAPLSTIEGETWEDDIYVSFTSTIGPNPISIIQWLIEKYTNYTVDSTSFTSVSSKLANYPNNFFIKARPNVLDLIRDIAYQSRCAIFIRDNIVYVTYLSEEPTSVRTLTEDDILLGSFFFEHSDTEDLETKHEISWREGETGINQDDETEFSFTLKHNIPKYGVFSAKYDYYTYNIFELVEKSATFWTIRKGNTWRYIEFDTPVKHLDLDIFDCITIDTGQFPTTKVIIEEATYDADENKIHFRAWTPIRSGESSPYFWAWPSQQDYRVEFPLTPQEEGDGIGITVIPPTDHPLHGGYSTDVALATSGDKYPSDLDDTLPTLSCKLATGSEVADDIEPAIEIQEPLAEENFRDKLAAMEAKGMNVNDGDDKEGNGACGQPSSEQFGCEYEVRVLYVSPDTITTRQPPDGNCKSAGPCEKGANNGRPCVGALWQMCHTFGALFAARFFQAGKKLEAERLWENCGYSTGVKAVYAVGDPVGIECDGCADVCEDTDGSGDPSHPAADVGQIRKPQCVGGENDDPGPNQCPGDDNEQGQSGDYVQT